MYVALIIYVYLCGLLCYRLKVSLNGTHLTSKQRDSLFLLLVFSALIIVASFRNYTVGIDTKIYRQNFELIKDIRFFDIFSSYYPLEAIGGDLEFGYVFLGKVCSFFSDSYYFFQLVICILTGWFSAKFIKENSDDVFMSTVLFLGLGIYLSSFNVARQWLAIAIACNGWSIIRKSKVKGFILLFIGVSIHYTILFLMVSVLVNMFRKSKFFIRLIPVVLVLCILEYEMIINMVAPYLPSKYQVYLDNLLTPQAQVLNFLTYALIFLILIRYIFIKTNVDVKHKYYSILAAVYAVCEIIGMSFRMFNRVGWPFMYFVLLLLPSFQQYIKKEKYRRVYRIGILVFYTFLFIHRAINTEEFIYSTYLFQ